MPLPEFTGLDDAGQSDFLEGIQANLLTGHGRRYSSVVFIEALSTIRPGSPELHWLTSLPITSAYEQEAQIASYKRAGTRSTQSVLNLLLTDAGYRSLGVPAHQIPRDIAFRRGAAVRALQRTLGPSPVRAWGAWARGNICFALLFANDSKEQIEADQAEILSAISEKEMSLRISGKIAPSTQDSELPRDAFGFADGISQPLFMKRHIQKFYEENERTRYDPSSNPFHSLLVQESGHDRGFGTYVVLQKFDQDRSLFAQATKEISEKSEVSNGLIEAALVGRFKDGTPLVISDKPQGLIQNDFDYTDDPHGHKCPYSAHIRLMNPRTDDPDDRSRRIARRGFLFEDEEGRRGLCFIGLQSDISRQYEFLMTHWANEPRLTDPLIGHGPKELAIEQGWGGACRGIRESIPDTITSSGTAYFFCPSLLFLRALG